MIGAVAALRLEPDAGTDQLVDNDSAAFAATEDFKQRFGDDAVVVLVKGDLEQLVLTSDLGTLLSLEGCLSGNVEGGKVFTDEPAPEPCARARRANSPRRRCSAAPPSSTSRRSRRRRCSRRRPRRPSARRSVAAAAAAREARRRRGSSDEQIAAAAAGRRQRGDPGASSSRSSQLAIDYGQSGLPAPRRPDLRQLGRLRPGRPGAAEAAVLDLLAERRRGPDPDPAEARPERVRAQRGDRPDPRGGRRPGLPRSATPSTSSAASRSSSRGSPSELSSEIVVLLVAALVVMALTLALIFGPPLRLLPLAIALVAAALTFGLLAAFGGSLTMASIAVLPILIGLAVDYAIQFQARFDEARAGGLVAAARRGRGGGARRAGDRDRGARDRGRLPRPAALADPDGPRLRPPAGRRDRARLRARADRRARGALADQALRDRRRRGRSRARSEGDCERRAAGRGRGSRERVAARSGGRTLAAAVAAPGRVLAVGLVVAVAGWARRHPDRGDLRHARARPQRPARAAERRRAPGRDRRLGRGRRRGSRRRPHRPRGDRLDGDFKQRVLARAGFGGEATSCAEQDAELCPVHRAPRPLRRRPARDPRRGRGRARPAAARTSSPPSSAASEDRPRARR